ncbi:MAG: hypothetical protein H6708_17060 [Kofleriaceae bacterium]|nr:hypothetical protein [Myxococcales bacterium]MCB9562116.1 hypothetical protein [Kofleriaceae bacterium]
MNDGPRRARVATVVAVVAVVAAALGAAACGSDGGVVVHVSQDPAIAAPIDRLHLYVGVDDGTAFAGVPRPEDDIALATPLTARAHTIALVAGDGMPTDRPLRVAVVGYAGDVEAGFASLDVGTLPSGYTLAYDLVLAPVDQVWETDTGCVGWPDGAIVGADDRDCDGYDVGAGDCDDHDPQTHPGAYDACDGDRLGIDDDCDDVVDDGDLDGDGATCQSDCDDADAERTPGRKEDCSGGVDNDCDERIDEGYPEVCGDGVDNDCDDAIDEMTEEICGDGEDNDCDQRVDEGRIGDGGVLDDDIDGDGVICALDCDDDDQDIFPGATEVCNQTDDDCDAAIDEGVNEDGDPALCIDDCDDHDEHVYPGAYDGCDPVGVNEDCDAAIDEGDLDMDGVGCLLDCDDNDPLRFPGNVETCDTHPDDDCNPATQPSPQPCLLYQDTATCYYGFRACDESAGAYSPECAAANDGLLPPRVCDDFFGCAADPGNRLACGADVDHACVQQLGPPQGGVCPQAQFPLDAGGGATTCSWMILGGPVQQGWTVGLIPQGGTVPAGLAATCQADFVVVAVPPGRSQGTFAVTLSVDGMVERTEVFVIDPERVAACDAPSLTCVTTTMPMP